MANAASLLPTIDSGYTSGFTVNYLDTTTWSPNKFPMTTYNWTSVQTILNLGIDFYNLPTYVRININVLKLALRQGYITIPKTYQPNQAPFVQR